MSSACSVCGRSADAAEGESPLGWTSDVDDRSGARLICPQCTREHVRAIEAKLDRDWW